MASVEAASVSVVIVSYNTKDVLLRCIASIDPNCEIIVVDNASQDGSPEAVEELPNVQLLRNDANIGFGRGNNKGIMAATRPLILLLNSDAYATEGAIQKLAQVFEDESIVAAGGQLLNQDGSTQESCSNRLTLWAVFCEQLWLEKLFRRSPFLSPYWMSARLLKNGDQPQEVAQVMGACLMFRPVEKFNGEFFLYCEDTELCARLASHGKILYVPEAKFYHDLGTSSASFRWRAIAMYNCGKELYFKIHHGSMSRIICLVLDRLGALLRFIVWLPLALFGLRASNKAHRNADGFYRVLVAPATYKGLIKAINKRAHIPDGG
jgi:hypothetical protein